MLSDLDPYYITIIEHYERPAHQDVLLQSQAVRIKFEKFGPDLEHTLISPNLGPGIPGPGTELAKMYILMSTMCGIKLTVSL